MNSTYPSFGARATILLALGMVGCGGGGGGTKDTTAPTAVISLDRTAALNGEIVVATVTASENVIGFTSADVSVVNGTVESVIVVSGSVYQVVVRMGATGSTCSFTIPNGAFTDRAGNELVAGGGGSVSLLPKDTGWASATGVNAQGKDFADLTVGTKTLRFVWIAAGTYEQGSPTSETSRNTDENKRTVTLTKGFWISQTEVPNSFWLATAPGYPASVTIPDDNKPVSGRTVSQIDGFIPPSSGREADGLCIATADRGRMGVRSTSRDHRTILVCPFTRHHPGQLQAA